MFTKYLWVLPQILTHSQYTHLHVLSQADPAHLPHPLPILVLDYTLRA